MVTKKIWWADSQSGKPFYGWITSMCLCTKEPLEKSHSLSIEYWRTWDCCLFKIKDGLITLGRELVCISTGFKRAYEVNPDHCIQPGSHSNMKEKSKALQTSKRWQFPSPADPPNPGIKLSSPALQDNSLPAEPWGKCKNTGVGSPSLLQMIFPTQESNWCLPHCRWIHYQLRYQGNANRSPTLVSKCPEK